MLSTAKGALVVVPGFDGVPSSYFWRGRQLTEVISAVVNLSQAPSYVRLRVQNTANFDAIYADMVAAGIIVKKAT